MIHGTYSTYARHGCRCDRCTTYQRDRVKRNRLDRYTAGRLHHGTRSAYDAGCRCPNCLTARRAAYPHEKRGTYDRTQQNQETPQ